MGALKLRSVKENALIWPLASRVPASRSLWLLVVAYHWAIDLIPVSFQCSDLDDMCFADGIARDKTDGSNVWED
jgi:hypothetical protein